MLGKLGALPSRFSLFASTGRDALAGGGFASDDQPREVGG
jgi:hypothetical protein